jgi:hypothetical protein
MVIAIDKVMSAAITSPMHSAIELRRGSLRGHNAVASTK